MTPPLMYTFGILKDTEPELATAKNLEDRLDPGVYSCSTFPSHKQVLVNILPGLEDDGLYAQEQAEFNKMINERHGVSVLPMSKEERVNRAIDVRIELGLPPLVETGVFRILEKGE